MNRDISPRWLVGCLAFALIGSASAQVTKQGSGYLLRCKYVKGQHLSYSMISSGSAMGKNFDMTMSFNQKVLEVDRQGIGKIEFTTSGMNLKLDGKPMNIGSPMGSKATTVKMNSRGQSVDGDSSMTNEAVTFPQGPVNIGQSWTGTTTASGAMGVKESVNATYTFAGIQSVGGVKAAKLIMHLKGEGKGAVSGDGVAFISVADGSLIKNNLKMVILMGTTKMPMTMSMARK